MTSAFRQRGSSDRKNAALKPAKFFGLKNKLLGISSPRFKRRGNRHFGRCLWQTAKNLFLQVIAETKICKRGSGASLWPSLGLTNFYNIIQAFLLGAALAALPREPPGERRNYRKAAGKNLPCTEKKARVCWFGRRGFQSWFTMAGKWLCLPHGNKIWL